MSLTNPPGTTGYVKDAGSSVIIVGNGGDPAQKGKIQQLAELNEMGVFQPSYFNAGTYTLETVVVVHPPLEYDEYRCTSEPQACRPAHTLPGYQDCYSRPLL